MKGYCVHCPTGRIDSDYRCDVCGKYANPQYDEVYPDEKPSKIELGATFLFFSLASGFVGSLIVYSIVKLLS